MRDYGYLEHMGMGVPRRITAACESTTQRNPI